MEGEFEDGFRGIILERRALLKDSFERLRAEHPLLPTELRQFQVLHTADILLGSDTFDIILNFRLMWWPLPSMALATTSSAASQLDMGRLFPCC